MTRDVRHIAIVGCGFSGTSAFHQIVERRDVDAITLFESTGDFGPGYAYRTDECADYLINNTTDTMCLGPDDRQAFLKWLRAREDIVWDGNPKGHLPRRLYGLFLQDTFQKTLERATAKGIKCRTIADEVTHVDERQDHVELQWRGGLITADAVILTTGRCPSLALCAQPAPSDAAVYVDNHVQSTALDELALDADVHILGASLSAYDVINRLFSAKTGCQFVRGDNGILSYVAGTSSRRATLYSRSGRLKKVSSTAPETLDRQSFTLPGLAASKPSEGYTLQGVADAIIDDGARHSWAPEKVQLQDPLHGCDDVDQTTERAATILRRDLLAAKAGGHANFLVDLFDQAQVDIWDGFAEGFLRQDAEKTYRRNYETAVLAYAGPCPLSTAERLLALIEAGVLRVVPGVGTPSLSASGRHFDVPHRYGTSEASVLIDTTGRVDRNVLSSKQPAWVQNCVASGNLQPYERVANAGASIDMQTFRPPSMKRVYFANMLLWGPGFFTSSAFMMATIVSRIIAVIFGDDEQLKR